MTLENSIRLLKHFKEIGNEEQVKVFEERVKKKLERYKKEGRPIPKGVEEYGKGKKG